VAHVDAVARTTGPGTGRPGAGGRGPSWRRWRLLVLLAVLAVGLVAIWSTGVHDLVRPERIAVLRQWVDARGALAPLVFIAGYAIAEVVFVPSLPLTVLGGALFGPAWGTAYVSVASTLGACLAFLLARYAARARVERWLTKSPRLARIDDVVSRHGWRILMVTRLVPVFPFVLQNFAYGLTRMRFSTFALVSWACMLPGTAAYTLAGSALAEGGGNPRRTVIYLGVAGGLIVAVSLIPSWLRRRSHAAAEVLAP